jgi:hypothetical protein
MQGEFAICDGDHYLIKPLFITGFVTCTQKDALSFWIKGKESAYRVAFALNS